jgi:hypothetical protein
MTATTTRFRLRSEGGKLRVRFSNLTKNNIIAKADIPAATHIEA